VSIVAVVTVAAVVVSTIVVPVAVSSSIVTTVVGQAPVPIVMATAIVIPVAVAIARVLIAPGIVVPAVAAIMFTPAVPARILGRGAGSVVALACALGLAAAGCDACQAGRRSALLAARAPIRSTPLTPGRRARLGSHGRIPRAS